MALVTAAPPRDRDLFIVTSSDTKPVYTAIGALVFETDTGLWFIWDGNSWETYLLPGVAP